MMRFLDIPIGVAMSIDELFTKIANEELDIPTLKPQNSDSKDFHDVSVWESAQH